MAGPGTPTFDQLRIFLAIVDTGSFAAAGRKLNRAVSVISYGIANLETQLGLTLFEREGTRKPKLTVAGRAVLAEVRAVSHGIDGLRATVKGLLEGLEAEVDLAIDVMLPPERVGRVLRTFAVEFPTVQLRLHVEALGAITAMVLDRKAAIGISGPLAAGIEGVECISAGSVPMVPVAAPDHPLGRMERIAPGAGRDYTQLVLTDRSRFTEGQDYSVLSPKTWRLADLGQSMRCCAKVSAGATCHCRSSNPTSSQARWSALSCRTIQAAYTALQASGAVTRRRALPPHGCSISS